MIHCMHVLKMSAASALLSLPVQCVLLYLLSWVILMLEIVRNR